MGGGRGDGEAACGVRRETFAVNILVIEPDDAGAGRGGRLGGNCSR